MTSVIEQLKTARSLIEQMEKDSVSKAAIKAFFVAFCDCNLPAWVMDQIDASNQELIDAIRAIIESGPTDYEPQHLTKFVNPGLLLDTYCAAAEDGGELTDLYGVYAGADGSLETRLLAKNSVACGAKPLTKHIIPDLFNSPFFANSVFRTNEQLYPSMKLEISLSGANEAVLRITGYKDLINTRLADPVRDGVPGSMQVRWREDIYLAAATAMVSEVPNLDYYAYFYPMRSEVLTGQLEDTVHRMDTNDAYESLIKPTMSQAEKWGIYADFYKNPYMPTFNLRLDREWLGDLNLEILTYRTQQFRIPVPAKVPEYTYIHTDVTVLEPSEEWKQRHYQHTGYFYEDVGPQPVLADQDLTALHIWLEFSLAPKHGVIVQDNAYWLRGSPDRHIDAKVWPPNEDHLDLRHGFDSTYNIAYFEDGFERLPYNVEAGTNAPVVGLNKTHNVAAVCLVTASKVYWLQAGCAMDDDINHWRASQDFRPNRYRSLHSGIMTVQDRATGDLLKVSYNGHPDKKNTLGGLPHASFIALSELTQLEDVYFITNKWGPGGPQENVPSVTIDEGGWSSYLPTGSLMESDATLKSVFPEAEHLDWVPSVVEMQNGNGDEASYFPLGNLIRRTVTEFEADHSDIHKVFYTNNVVENKGKHVFELITASYVTWNDPAAMTSAHQARPAGFQGDWDQLDRLGHIKLYMIEDSVLQDYIANNQTPIEGNVGVMRIPVPRLRNKNASTSVLVVVDFDAANYMVACTSVNNSHFEKNWDYRGGNVMPPGAQIDPEYNADSYLPPGYSDTPTSGNSMEPTLWHLVVMVSGYERTRHHQLTKEAIGTDDILINTGRMPFISHVAPGLPNGFSGIPSEPQDYLLLDKFLGNTINSTAEIGQTWLGAPMEGFYDPYISSEFDIISGGSYITPTVVTPIVGDPYEVGVLSRPNWVSYSSYNGLRTYNSQPLPGATKVEIRIRFVLTEPMREKGYFEFAFFVNHRNYGGQDLDIRLFPANPRQSGGDPPVTPTVEGYNPANGNLDATLAYNIVIDPKYELSSMLTISEGSMATALWSHSVFHETSNGPDVWAEYFTSMETQGPTVHVMELLFEVEVGTGRKRTRIFKMPVDPNERGDEPTTTIADGTLINARVEDYTDEIPPEHEYNDADWFFGFEARVTDDLMNNVGDTSSIGVTHISVKKSAEQPDLP